MKNPRVVIAGVIVAACVAAALLLRPWEKGGPAVSPALVQGEVYYTCAMHPSVISTHPGACPVCGMALVRRVYGVQEGAPGETQGTVTVSAAQRVAANISTVEARVSRLDMSVTAPGIVAVAEPGRSVVAARERGRIVRLFVDRTGTRVRKGEPLLSLYSPDVAGAEEEYIVALNAGADSSGGVIAGAARRRLRERFGLTDAQIASLRNEGDVRDDVTYLSPIAGTVVGKSVVEGEYVDEGTALFQLADLSRLWVTASVPEQEIGRLRAGERAGISVEAFPGETFQARVVLLEPLLEQESRSLRVRLEIPNPDGRLLPNMYARVELRLEEKSALVVPSPAVLYTGDHPVVWVETSPGVFAPRAVETGATAGGETEILSGLRAGEMVAATGGFLIDSESRLESPAPGPRANSGDAPRAGAHDGHGM